MRASQSYEQALTLDRYAGWAVGTYWSLEITLPLLCIQGNPHHSPQLRHPPPQQWSDEGCGETAATLQASHRHTPPPTLTQRWPSDLELISVLLTTVHCRWSQWWQDWESLVCHNLWCTQHTVGITVSVSGWELADSDGLASHSYGVLISREPRQTEPARDRERERLRSCD